MNSPYISSEINTAFKKVFGVSTGRILNGLEITENGPVVNLTGRGKPILSAGEAIRFEDLSSPGFLASSIKNNWFVVGGNQLIFSGIDQEKRRNFLGGSVLAVAPTTFTDTVNSPFAATDVGKWITVYKGANANAFKITAYINISSVTIAAATFVNQSSILYSIPEARDNWGIYRVNAGISATVLEIYSTKKFVTLAAGQEELEYAEYSPPNVEVSPGNFSCNGIKVSVNTTQTIDYPVDVLYANPPPLYLYAETQDDREDSPTNIKISVGQVSARNAVVLAVKYMSYGRHLTGWMSASSFTAESIRGSVDDVSSAIGKGGCYSNGLDYFVDMAKYPPELVVKSPKRIDGGEERKPLLVSANSTTIVDTVPSFELLRVPLNNPVLGERIDKLFITSRTTKEEVLDGLEGVVSPNKPIGEVALKYRLGVSSALGYRTTDPSSGRTIPEASPVLSLAVNSGIDINSTVSNNLGVTVKAFADLNVIAPFSNAGIRFYANSSQYGQHGDYTSSIAPQNTGVKELVSATDIHGTFHFAWIETESGVNKVWYCRLDAFGNTQITAPVRISDTNSRDLSICVSLTQQVSLVFIDIATDLVRTVRFVGHAAGGVSSIIAEANLDATPSQRCSIQCTYETERYFYFRTPLGGGAMDVTCKASDSTTLVNPTVYGESNIGVLSNVSMTSKIVSVRTEDDEILAFTAAKVYTADDNWYSVFGVKVSDIAAINEGWIAATEGKVTDVLDLTDVIALQDGRVIVLGTNGTSVFANMLSKSLQSMSNSRFALGVADSYTAISGTHVYPSGEVIIQATAFNGGAYDTVFSNLEISLEGNMPETPNGISPDVFSGSKEFLLAEIKVLSGAIPDYPGLGLHIATDATPAGPSVLSSVSASAIGMRDGSRIATTVATAAGMSVGMMSTKPNVSAIMLLDDVESDGFDDTIDPLSVMTVYSSLDNSNWILRAVRDVYRVNGNTIIKMVSSTTDEYIKVYFSAQLLIPYEASDGSDSFAMSIGEVRLFETSPGDTSSATSENSVSVPGLVEISQKNLPDSKDIYVGDGYQSFGEYSGFEGIQKAVSRSLSMSLNSYDKNVFPESNRKVVVGPGLYIVSSSLNFPGGTNIEFMPGAILVDERTSDSGLSYLCYSTGVYGTFNVYEKTRQVYLSENCQMKGIKVGSSVRVVGPTTRTETFVSRISKGGRILHLADIIPESSAATDITVYNAGVRIDGMKARVLKNHINVAAISLMSFNQLSELVLNNVEVTDRTPISVNTYTVLEAYMCKKVRLDDIDIGSIGADAAIHINICESVSGGSVRCSCLNTGFKMNDVSDFRGFSSLVSRGNPSVPGGDMTISSVTGDNPFGRFSINPSSTRAGLLLSGVSVGFDEFINMDVHREGLISLLNNGIYEQLLAMVTSEVQAINSSPLINLPSGWVDGFVNSSIIDALESH